MVTDMVDSPTQDDRDRRFSFESFFTAEPVEDDPSIETPAMIKTTISNGTSGKNNLLC